MSGHAHGPIPIRFFATWTALAQASLKYPQAAIEYLGTQAGRGADPRALKAWHSTIGSNLLQHDEHAVAGSSCGSKVR
ncbi:hypothetical protein BZM27_16210 [Paraburkholderia steynii]|uniref:Uncharacterized protein n=1 Tax=Paraburkholderia steynii TaxID=1245441 RepID=A0A4R0XKI1_9BURK|nr:hypothetical protein BZM27_16210 [Paraburkholderia steynii]